MSTARPKPVATADGRDLGDEYLFYDRGHDRVHVLNSTAREIFLLCDGKRTAAEVAAAFGKKHELEQEAARRDAAEVIRELSELGVLSLE